MVVMKKLALLGSALLLGLCAAAQDLSEYDDDGDLVHIGNVSPSQFVEGLEKGLKLIELKKGYKSPIGYDERQKIIDSVNARHDYIWVPRKLSTVIGRLEETLRYAKAGFQAFDIGKIIGISIAARNMDDAIDMLVEEGMYQGSAFGEAAYWMSAIAVGLFNGRSLADAISDGYDERYIGKWSKAGYEIGEWLANAVNSMPWKEAERDAADKAFRDALIREGINEDGLAVVDKWLSLDRETRIKMPIKVDSSWFEKDNGGSDGQVCRPGDDPFDSEPEDDGGTCPGSCNGSTGGGSSGGCSGGCSSNARARRGGGGDTSAKIW